MTCPNEMSKSPFSSNKRQLRSLAMSKGGHGKASGEGIERGRNERGEGY